MRALEMAPGMALPSTIVFAVDFSRASAKALHTVGELAQKLDAKVVLVHAYASWQEDTKFPATVDDSGPLPLLLDEGPMTNEDARFLTESWADALREYGVDAPVVLDERLAEVAILAAADAHEADLIVMGRTGHGRLRRLVLGSVSRYVTDHSKRGVMLLPDGED